MDVMELMRARHSVRAYESRPVEEEKVALLEAELAACNAQGGLRMRAVFGEKGAFSSAMAKYGKFSGVENYIAVVAEKGAKGAAVRAGYYGERAVLAAQALGLNTCWAVMTFSKRKAKKYAALQRGEKLLCVIAFGYGKTQGVPHRSKPLAKVINAPEDAPAWFVRGAEAALLAPTAMNGQKFLFTLLPGGTVRLENGGFCAALDRGILKYHFELGAGKENFRWEE